MMINRSNLLERYPEFTDGMEVRSTDGERLGKVAYTSDDSFVVEKGIFFPKDFSARFDDVSEVRDGVVYLKHGREQFEPWHEESYAGWSDIDRLNAAPEPTQAAGTARTTTGAETVNIPVVEEELEAQKRIREGGQVRVRKTVHTEYKHFTVPVTKEEVRIERVPVEPGTAAAAQAAGEMKEETITIPVREEEVEAVKRPVVKEEVRVSKTAREEEREVAGEVRKQEVEVEREAGIEKPRKKAG